MSRTKTYGRLVASGSYLSLIGTTAGFKYAVKAVEEDSKQRGGAVVMLFRLLHGEFYSWEEMGFARNGVFTRTYHAQKKQKREESE